MSDDESRDEVDKQLHKNYYFDDGVTKWPIVYPIAASGSRQSPINIVPSMAKVDDTLKPLEIQYEEDCVNSLINKGNTWQADIIDDKTALTGGALGDDIFRLIQFHAHWGSSSGAKGSEHTVEGKLYTGELHLVHWNTKYDNFETAMGEPDGLAVVAVFLEVCEDGETHDELDKLTSALEDIPYKNNQIEAGDRDIRPDQFLPGNLSYWHYPGSLTTPPFNESVLWHVLKEPVKISKKQVKDMTSLRTGTCESDHYCTALYNNFRPPVPGGEERELSSFDENLSSSSDSDDSGED